ncbi:MAG: SPFH domain-containing protein [Actinomycetota bacterium]
MHTTDTYLYQQHERTPAARGLRSFRAITVTVPETEHGVVMVDGRIDRVAPTGRLRIRPRRDRLVRLPATPQIVIIPGQEMLTEDGAGVRATAAATVRITDPMTVVRDGGWHQPLYLRIQLALRTLVAGLSLEDLLGARARLDGELRSAVEPAAGPLGLELLDLAIRDLIIPGELKRAVADVVAARLSGQAALERARGETAALRSLANAAKAAADNPALLQLRLIQQIEQSDGNTYVIGSNPLLGD